MSEPKRRMQLATPCDNRWEDLEPRGDDRYCRACDRVVVDLMHVTAAEAWRRFDAAGGELCARLREDDRGNAVFRYAPPVKKGVGAVVLSAALAACGTSGDDPAAPVDLAPPEAPVEALPEPPPAVPVETSPELPVAPPEPPAETADVPAPPDPGFLMLGEPDGSDHPAHQGYPHVARHHRAHGRMGGVRIIRDPRLIPDDPLQGI
ncbi:MAG: hypothetical protein KC619_13550 [Myxococcales bacterium]|nr:hypothetical protein [Myxococcales bacterium]